jgi:hypothetical protein
MQEMGSEKYFKANQKDRLYLEAGLRGGHECLDELGELSLNVRELGRERNAHALHGEDQAQLLLACN